MSVKGQASFEYQIAYAAVILITLVMIAGLVYFGFMNTDNVIKPSCTLSNDISCEEFKLENGTAYLDLKVGQNTPYQITVTKIKCTQQTGSQLFNFSTVNVVVPVDGEKWIASTSGTDSAPTSVCCLDENGVCYSNSREGGVYKGKIWVKYTEIGGVSRTISGDIVAVFEP